MPIAAQTVGIRGGQIVYELLGPPTGQPIVLTPGGRFGKDVPGLRPLARAREDAWERALEAQSEGRGNLFATWIQAAPLILDFAKGA